MPTSSKLAIMDFLSELDRPTFWQSTSNDCQTDTLFTIFLNSVMGDVPIGEVAIHQTLKQSRSFFAKIQKQLKYVSFATISMLPTGTMQLWLN